MALRRLRVARCELQRDDVEQGPDPAQRGPHRGRGRLVAAIERRWRIERLDLPLHPPAVPRIDLVVAGERHGGGVVDGDEQAVEPGGRRRADHEREPTLGIDVEVRVVDVGHDAVRPLPRGRLVVDGEAEVGAVAPPAADPVRQPGIDGREAVPAVGVVTAPPSITAEWAGHVDEQRAAGVREQVGVEGDAECGQRGAIPVGDASPVAHGPRAVEEAGIERADAVEQLVPRGGHVSFVWGAHGAILPSGSTRRVRPSDRVAEPVAGRSTS